jgi:hypothetical protein
MIDANPLPDSIVGASVLTACILYRSGGARQKVQLKVLF